MACAGGAGRIRRGRKEQAIINVAVSNIAWNPDEDEAVAAVLRERGVRGVEVAPTKIWPRPLEASDADVARYRGWWEKRGIRIVAMQALLFGRTDLVIFGSEVKRTEAIEYLEGIIRLGGKLGAHALVFGSPKNRRVESLPAHEVERIALPFFRRLGDTAAKNDTAFCIEPNAPLYQCDYVQTSAEGVELVRAVGSEGFALHLDAAAMTLCGEDVESALAASLPVTRHFHVSEPDLAPIATGEVDHRRFARALVDQGYSNWVSIEMRAPKCGENVANLRSALEIVQGLFPDTASH